VIQQIIRAVSLITNDTMQLGASNALEKETMLKMITSSNDGEWRDKTKTGEGVGKRERINS
jgi:hypothetical protein